jgi:hypothetical protein
MESFERRSYEEQEQLRSLLPKLQFYDRYEDIRAAIEEMLTPDPRATHYKRNKYMDVIGFCIDVLNVLTKFDEDGGATVVGVEDWSKGPPADLAKRKSQKEAATMKAKMQAKVQHDSK